MIQILYSLKYHKSILGNIEALPISKIISDNNTKINLKKAVIFITDDPDFIGFSNLLNYDIKIIYIIFILSSFVNINQIGQFFSKINVLKNQVEIFYEIITEENLNLKNSISGFLGIIFDKVYLNLQELKFNDIPKFFVESIQDFLCFQEVYFLTMNPFNDIIKTYPLSCGNEIKDIFRRNILDYRTNSLVQRFNFLDNLNSRLFLFSFYNIFNNTSFSMLYLKIDNNFSDYFSDFLVNKILSILDFLNSRLAIYYKLQRNIEEIKALYNVSLIFGITSSVDELIKLIVKKAKNVFKADVCTLMLIDNDELYIKYSLGLPEEVKNIRQKIGEGIAGMVAQSGQSLIINDIDKVTHKFSFEKNYKSSIVVPLKVRENKVIGVLSISKFSFYPFTQDDLKILYNLANIAATGIEKAKLYQDLDLYSSRLEESYINTIKSLAKAFEARDKYNKGHMERVLKYGLAIASEIDSSLLNDDVLKLSLLFHDIGKIEIPDSILNKPSKLTDEEYEIIKRHPEAGEEILKNVKFLQEVAEIVKQHQERWDGKGYPRKLKGEQIHLYARIVALADAFDAMTSDRVYRKAMSVEEAVEEIKRNSGTQFDPFVVEAFLRAYQNGLIKVEDDIQEEFVEIINIKNLREKG